MRIYRTLVIFMNRVVAKFKIFPKDVETDLDDLKKEIEHSLPVNTSVYKYEEEPIAFGLTLLFAHVLMHEEESGKMDDVERAIKELSGVSEVEVVMVRRV